MFAVNRQLRGVLPAKAHGVARKPRGSSKHYPMVIYYPRGFMGYAMDGSSFTIRTETPFAVLHEGVLGLEVKELRIPDC